LQIEAGEIAHVQRWRWQHRRNNVTGRGSVAVFVRGFDLRVGQHAVAVGVGTSADPDQVRTVLLLERAYGQPVGLQGSGRATAFDGRHRERGVHVRVGWHTAVSRNSTIDGRLSATIDGRLITTIGPRLITPVDRGIPGARSTTAVVTARARCILHGIAPGAAASAGIASRWFRRALVTAPRQQSAQAQDGRPHRVSPSQPRKRLLASRARAFQT
jgi:hypothetical protein